MIQRAQNRRIPYGRPYRTAILWCSATLTASGCGLFPEIPGTYRVQLPGGRFANARLGSGPTSLANTRWACYRQDNGRFIVNVEFGPNGEVKRFYENAVYFPDILGPELIPDGRVRSNPFPGMTYSAGSFGASSGGEFGFASPLNIWIAGIKVATGVSYAFGMADGDHLNGTFGYRTQVFGEGSPFSTGGQDEYEFYAIKLN